MVAKKLGMALGRSLRKMSRKLAVAGVSFWAGASQVAPGGGSATVMGEPEVGIPGFSDPSGFQINIALNRLDGSYGAPFGLLGSQRDSGTDTSPWKDSSGAPIVPPGSLMIGGSGEDLLIGNSGNDTLIGGTPANPQAGVLHVCQDFPTRILDISRHTLLVAAA